MRSEYWAAVLAPVVTATLAGDLRQERAQPLQAGKNSLTYIGSACMVRKAA